MADDAADAWNVLEILLAECIRRLDSTKEMPLERRQEDFSTRLLKKMEALANRAKINSPVRFHQSPFNANIIVSLWCPWTVECMIADPRLDVRDEKIRTTLEKWITWGQFYNAGGEPDLRIQNQDLWPPSGNSWEVRTATSESECRSFLESRDSKGLSSLFSVSPRAFVFALDSWAKQFDCVFEASGKHFSVLSLTRRNDVSDAALAEVSEVLSLISEAQANVERESDAALFGLDQIERLKSNLGTMLSNKVITLSESWRYPNLRSECRRFEKTLMRRWLTELAHSTGRIPACQIPSLDDRHLHELDIAARKAGNVPYWDDANSTLWLNGKQRCYAEQLADESRGIFNSLEKVNWTQAAPCLIPAIQARQCCKDRTTDNKLGIKFKYNSKPKTISANWEKQAPQKSPKLPETPETPQQTR